MIEPETEARPAPKVGDIANLGKPILLKDMNMAGVSAEAAQGGQKVQMDEDGSYL